MALRIERIEPTPNPNSMKITVEPPLPEGVSYEFVRDQMEAAPPHLRSLLAVDGVKSVFAVADFIAVERFAQAPWQAILDAVRHALDAGPVAIGEQEPPGKIAVFIQLFRGLPMQIKLLTESQDIRIALPERIAGPAKKAALLSSDFLAERKWEGRGIRYGDPTDVGAEVLAEVEAAYGDERVANLLQRAIAQGDQLGAAAPREPLAPAVVRAQLREKDWRLRYAALDQLEPESGALDVILQALADENAGVRRLAVVYLGQVDDARVLPHLVNTMQDPSAAVRRAAGDCLSDLQATAAIPAMCRALSDPSKLVRWRAARFLYEVGDESALAALRSATADSEFEIRLQATLAIERIEAGGAAVEPAWRRLIREGEDGGQR